jgi:hypothetical protein
VTRRLEKGDKRVKPEGRHDCGRERRTEGEGRQEAGKLYRTAIAQRAACAE